MRRGGAVGYGFYEAAGTAERQAHPYLRLDGLGQEVQGDTSKPYDLNAPGAVAEIKQALRALAQRDADPLRNPADPVQETVWQDMILSGPHADAWEGAAADELVTAISRYAPASQIEGPFIQLGGSSLGKYGIVGGAQPTARGLEVIAGALETRLGGVPSMPLYMAWRGGTFAPPSVVSGPPPTAQVTPSRRHGPFWDPTGYTPMWEGAPADIQDTVTKIDESLISCIQQQEQLQTESQRLLGVNDCLRSVRATRHQAVLIANQGAPPPECPVEQHYDAAEGACVPDTGIVNLPPPTVAGCIDAYMTIEGKTRAEAEAICKGPGGGSRWASVGGAVLLGGAVGLGLYYLTTTRRRSR